MKRRFYDRNESPNSAVSRTTAWRAIRENRLIAIAIDKGSFRIPEEELRRFVLGRGSQPVCYSAKRFVKKNRRDMPVCVSRLVDIGFVLLSK